MMKFTSDCIAKEAMYYDCPSQKPIQKAYNSVPTYICANVLRTVYVYVRKMKGVDRFFKK